MAFMWLALAGALGQSGGTSAGAVQRVLNAPEEDQRATPSVDVPSPSLKETTSGEVGLVLNLVNSARAACSAAPSLSPIGRRRVFVFVDRAVVRASVSFPSSVGAWPSRGGGVCE